MVDNKVILIGRLTKDVELKTTPNGKPVCNFILAVNKPYNKENDHPEASWVDCVVWNKQAEFLSKYFSKGNRVGICGHINTRSWEDKDGNKRKTTEVIVEEIGFIDKKSDNNNDNNNDDGVIATPNDDDELPM